MRYWTRSFLRPPTLFDRTTIRRFPILGTAQPARTAPRVTGTADGTSPSTATHPTGC
ncbi:hypothetical protein HMPREF0063_11290 [Aeromicrobium marinum DSM 15272]|uniref:Uncharacterized protein n=1 Tax=Aeromicrobium marinum DSM 15272 TaxID=585531 RepID=E2SB81_9ACTN|nr:hypothetical protein HMPREF0063_11290 [Aeromicrobium marinum DSM 15272]